MEKKIETRKKVVKAVVWIVVILALLATTHIVVHSLDLFEFVKKIHGG